MNSSPTILKLGHLLFHMIFMGCLEKSFTIISQCFSLSVLPVLSNSSSNSSAMSRFLHCIPPNPRFRLNSWPLLMNKLKTCVKCSLFLILMNLLSGVAAIVLSIDLFCYSKYNQLILISIMSCLDAVL